MFEELLGFCRRGGVDDQPAVDRVDPAISAAAADEGTRQQFEGHFLLDLAHLATTDTAAFGFLDLLGLVAGEAFDDRGRQQFFLDPEGEQPLLVDGVDECAAVPWRDPADAARIGGVASLLGQFVELRRQLLSVSSPVSGQAVEMKIFEPHERTRKNWPL